MSIAWAFWLFVAAFSVLVLAVLWMRWRMRASKSRFALAVLSALVTCVTAGLLAAGVGFPQLLLGNLLEYVGLPADGLVPDFGSLLLLFGFVGFVAYRISRFGSDTIKNWDAPLRVSEKQLAEDLEDDKLLPLARNGFATLLQQLQGKPPDLPASDLIPDWRNREPEVPRPVPTWVLMRDLFLARFSEASISDDGWRAASNLWVGDIAERAGRQIKPLLLLVCRDAPTKEELQGRLLQLNGEVENPETQIFAVYPSGSEAVEDDLIIQAAGRKVQIFSSRSLVKNALDLDFYARRLLAAFESDPIGGTLSTLARSYVELSVIEAGDRDAQPRPLFEVLRDWESEHSRRHLAITGEYGQGKSSAMLKYCAEWAKAHLNGEAQGKRVPLLIELRGRNPTENDPLSFLAAWCVRYRLNPGQIFNLIRSGDAVVIFEGFDELRGAGREYDRFNHFNALWRFAYDGVKVIFTGRPNFFIDDAEANRTLRHHPLRGGDGGVFTTVFRLQPLSRAQIGRACRDYPETVRTGIVSLIAADESFAEILSRPSMLPVVATIWPTLRKKLNEGIGVNGANLIGLYIDASFKRKEAELQKDQIEFGAPSASRYLLFNTSVRKLLTGGVAWLMAEKGYQNTISRSEIFEYIASIYESLFKYGKSNNVARDVSISLSEFENTHNNKSLSDRIEIITNEICSAGLLIPDPVTGDGYLRFAHKQFFEYFVALATVSLVDIKKADPVWDSIAKINRTNALIVTKNIPVACKFYCQIVGEEFPRTLTPIESLFIHMNIRIIILLEITLSRFAIFAYLTSIFGFGSEHFTKMRLFQKYATAVMFYSFFMSIIFTMVSYLEISVELTDASILINIPGRSLKMQYIFIIFSALSGLFSCFVFVYLVLHRYTNIIFMLYAWGNYLDKFDVEGQVAIATRLVHSPHRLPRLGMSDEKIAAEIFRIRSPNFVSLDSIYYQAKSKSNTE